MKIRIQVLIFALFFFGAGLAVADVTAGMGVNGVFQDSSAAAMAAAEFSAASTLYSSDENAVYAGLSGTAILAPASSAGEFSGTANAYFSRLAGLDSAGVKFSLEGGQSGFTGEEWLAGSLSFPVTRNGESFSFSVTPQVVYAPLPGGYVSAGVGTALSFAVCELIVKPVFSFASFWYDDGARMYEAGPGLRISWYPGFPLMTEVSTAFRHLADPETAVADSYFETDLLAVVSPFDWLLFTAEACFSYPDKGFPSGAFAESSFFVHRLGVQALSIPLHFRYTADTVAVYEIGAGIRYFF